MSSPTPEEVRTEAAAWVEANWDPEITTAEWWRRLADAGYAAPTLPPEAGGRGWSTRQGNEVLGAIADAGAVGPPTGLGVMLAAPTIATHGTPEQIERYIPPILDGTDAWCQLFSEPGAGSDLAGLQCKAELDGDEWVVSGQKVWTSGGHIAQKGMLIARTDPAAPKHAGITYFVIDMDQPGIDVRPLREMTGRALFNEVFLDEARVPADAVIGGLGNGWAVANTTLMFERTSLGSGRVAVGMATPGPKAGALDKPVGTFARKVRDDGTIAVGPSSLAYLVDLARKLGKVDDPIVRQALARLHTLTEINRLSGLRAKAAGQRTGGEGNLAKLAMSELYRENREAGNLIVGADGMLDRGASAHDGVVQEITVFSPGPSIYGGTDQVQRNILGERILGLPKEPGPAKGTPFRDLPQN